MTSEPATTTARPACKYPGCDQPAAPAAGPGRPPEYCEGRGHTKVTAWRERRRLAAAAAGTTTAADTDKPVTHARLTGAELLRSWRAEADRLAGIVEPAARRHRDPDRPDCGRSRGGSRPRRRRAAGRGRRSRAGRRRAARRRG